MSNVRRPALVRLVSCLIAFAAAPAFAGSVINPFVEQPWTPHGATTQARYGGVVAPAGDVNGDGFSDVMAEHGVGHRADLNQMLSEADFVSAHAPHTSPQAPHAAEPPFTYLPWYSSSLN